MTLEDLVTVYWATILDNVIQGYDVATHSFSKDGLLFLKFKDRCFFVTEKELPLGIKKAKRIAHNAAKGSYTASTVCVLKAQFPKAELCLNDSGGFGMFRLGSTFPVSALFLVVNDHLEPFLEKELLTLQQQGEVKHERS